MGRQILSNTVIPGCCNFLVLLFNMSSKFKEIQHRRVPSPSNYGCSLKAWSNPGSGGNLVYFEAHCLLFK